MRADMETKTIAEYHDRTTGEILSPDEMDRWQWADAIKARWQDAVSSIIDVGQMLIQAKESLPHGEFGPMCKDLKWSGGMVRMLMSIGRHPVLSNRKHVSDLPPHWGTLYELTKLPDEMMEQGIEDGTVNPEMERKDVKRWRQALEVDKQSENVLEDLPEGKYRALIIDPPWPTQKILREERPNQDVMDYPTMKLDEIAKLPVDDLAHGEGCHIYLWVTHKHLPSGLGLFELWGVKYQCLMTWVKPTGMTPFTWMYNTEHVLFGRIGSLKVQQMGMKLSFEAPVTKHSEKPDAFYELVREASPAPRLEMFSRKERDGFEVWGNEVGL